MPNLSVINEIPVQYRERSHDSPPKLNTIKDWFKVILAILKLLGHSNFLVCFLF
jgi:hypothetical protein